jgi:DNA-binding transcriptional ArsR family regulator
VIRIRLDDATLHRTRVATSPLWESLSSLALLVRFRGDVPSPYREWARRARRTMPEGMRQELQDWLGSLRVHRLPAFLTPLPESPRPTMADELAVLRAMAAGEDATDDESQSAAVSQRFAGGSAAVAQFADRLEEYWEVAIAPYWTAISSALEEEILIRGRTLATDGPSAMLAELGGRVIWQPPQLSAPYQTDSAYSLTETAFVLVPVIFGAGTRIFSSAPGAAGVSYQARGAGVLEGISTEPAADDTADRMATLIGRSRAAVVRSLIAPATTTALAKATGLAPSTVSQHLSTLVAAGIVCRHRVGSRVLYELDKGGQVLVEQLDDDPY